MATQDYKIATFAAGVAGLARVNTILTATGADPFPAPFWEGTQAGLTVSGLPVEQGYPYCEWQWSMLLQSDFNLLCAYISNALSGVVYIRTRTNVGSSYTYANYKAVMYRPTADIAMGNRRENVVVKFTRLEIQT